MEKIELSINNWCKSCGICAEFCVPLALDWNRGAKPVFIEEKCNGCGLCVMRCPDFAINMEVIKA